MIKIFSQTNQDGDTEYLWNISQRQQSGSRGIEVQLVQYLLFSRSRFLSDGAFGIEEVDGIWGAKTEKYMEVNVRQSRIRNELVDDHFMSPLPPGTVHFDDGKKEYKLAALQFGYIAHISDTGAAVGDLDVATRNNLILGMPDDGFCPTQLATALRTVKAANGLDS